MPVPFSPVMRMLASVTATFSTVSRMRLMASLSPQNIGLSSGRDSSQSFGSRCCRLSRQALRSEAMSLSLSHGFTMKSTAPCFMAFTARSMSAYAVNSTTLVSGYLSAICLSQ